MDQADKLLAKPDLEGVIAALQPIEKFGDHPIRAQRRRSDQHSGQGRPHRQHNGKSQGGTRDAARRQRASTYTASLSS